MGFGEAALALTNLFRFTPGTESGKPVESDITTTINFALPTQPAGPPPPKELIELARKLVAVTGAKTDIKQAMENDLNKEFELDEMEDPMPPAERQAAFNAVQEVWAEFSERILTNLAEAYARRLTRSEIEAAIAFYESSLGRRLLSQTPLAYRDARLLSHSLLAEEKKAVHSRFCQKQPSSARCYDPGAT